MQIWSCRWFVEHRGYLPIGQAWLIKERGASAYYYIPRGVTVAKKTPTRGAGKSWGLF
jgi:hypothetical protein